MLNPVEGIPERLGETATHLPGPLAEVFELKGPIAGWTNYTAFRISLHVLRPGPMKVPEARSRNALAEVFMQVEHRHGSEKYELASGVLQHEINTLLELPTATLFGLLYELWFCRREAEALGYRQAAERYGDAFVNGRLRSRANGAGGIRVWIAEGEDLEPRQLTVH